MTRLAFASILLAAACTATANIVPDVCGNGVLDPGEDCDSPDRAVCTATCELVCSGYRGSACTGEPDGTCCPADFQCGVDNVCHAPTGEVTNVVEVPFDTATFTVSDVNGDNLADAFGIVPGSVEVLYGDATAPMSRSASTPAPLSNGQVAFGDFDGDGREDVVLPVAAGLFEFSNATGQPEPVPFPATSTLGITHLQIAAAPGGSGVLFLDDLLDPTGKDILGLGGVETDFQTPLINGGSDVAVCAAANSPTSDLRGRALHAFQDGARTLLPITLNNAVCVVAVTTTGDVVSEADTLEPETLIGPDTKFPSTSIGDTFLAQVLGDSACPDLVVPATKNGQGISIVVHAGSGATPGSCTVATPICNVGSGCSGAGFGSDGNVEDETFFPGFPLAAIQVADGPGTTTAGLITTFGIFDGSGSAGAEPIVPPTRTWRSALVADVDGNGLQDFVTTGTGPDIEVFLQVAGPPFPAFQPYFIATADTVQFLATGDYDGDGNGDIAFMTIDDSGQGDLQIAYGGAPGGFAVTDFGTITEPHNLMGLDLIDDSLPVGFDHTDDLLVSRGGSSDPTSGDPGELVAVFGSPDRTLSAPFVFRTSFGLGSPSSTRASGVSVIAGGFGGSGSAGMIVDFEASPFYVNTDTASERVLAALGSAGDTFAVAGASAVPDGDCPDDGNGNGPCLDNAKYNRFSFTGLPDLLMVARNESFTGTDSDECMDDYVAAPGAPVLSPLPCATLAQPGSDTLAETDLTGISTTRVLDNVGSAAHYMINVGSIGGTTGSEKGTATFVWELSVFDGEVPQLTNVIDVDREVSTAVAGSTSVHCSDAVDIELGTHTAGGVTFGSGVPEIAVACSVPITSTTNTTQLWARYANPDPTQPPFYAKLVDLGVDVEPHMHVGDVNGDGLDDLLFTAAASQGASALDLVVLEQCDTHSTACSGSGGGQ